MIRLYNVNMQQTDITDTPNSLHERNQLVFAKDRKTAIQKAVERVFTDLFKEGYSPILQGDYHNYNIELWQNAKYIGYIHNIHADISWENALNSVKTTQIVSYTA